MTDKLKTKEITMNEEDNTASMVIKGVVKDTIQLHEKYHQTDTALKNIGCMFTMTKEHPKLRERLDKIASESTDTESLISGFLKVANLKTTPEQYLMMYNKDIKCFKYGVFLFYGISHGKIASDKNVNGVMKHTINLITNWTALDKDYVEKLLSEQEPVTDEQAIPVNEPVMTEATV